MADANMEHHGGGVQPEHFMAAFERIAAGLSQQNAQIYQDFQSYLQGYQQQLQQQLQAQHAHREHKIEGVSMPTYHGRPHESVDEFIFRAKLFMQGKCINFMNPQNGPRVVAMLAANFRDGAASWYHAKVMVEHVAYHTIDELHGALAAEFVPPDQQFRLRAELRQCQQRGSVDDYVKDFRRLMAQIHVMHALDQVDHFCEDAIAAAQAYGRTHFSGERGRQPSSSRVAAASDGPTPMDLSVVDSRQIDKRTCRERNLCFYCKEVGHRIANCPRSNGQNTGRAQGNGVARQM
ncbi:Retrotransposon gag protein [Phytophthora infestans]|uniref:Retrotransposon gag protein n=1 Tax=Phytophthora infestans TaxID=4787 RepID=A0A833WJ23_PHYIN|nr:Retrotransposon gag protein [Phytophthora infestans]KAF4139863.1 Retrotransposon gag protein [Phytophthora infestans]